MARKRRSGSSKPKQQAVSWQNGLVRVVASPGLEELLADEMSSLEIDGQSVPGGFEAVVDEADLMVIHLYSRLASKVMFEVGGTSASSLEAMAQGIRKIPWHLYFDSVDRLKIQIELRGSRLKQKSAIEKKARWSIKDALSGTSRSRRPARRTDYRSKSRPPELLIRVKGQKAWYSLNASGDHLYRRGWREHVSAAPIRENLAAAMLAFAQWSPGEPLVDPMCGSGTIPIEAGCIANGLFPGARRRFAFEDWPVHDATLFARLQGEALESAQSVDGLILGGDIHQKAIDAAVHNVKKAGLTDQVFFQLSPFKALQSPGQPGLVLTNPPYGHRLNDAQNVGDLYGHIGRVLKARWSGWRVGILVPDLRLQSKLDLNLESVAQFRNGGIQVWLLMGVI